MKGLLLFMSPMLDDRGRLAFVLLVGKHKFVCGMRKGF